MILKVNIFRCVSISINLNFTHSQTNRHIALFRKGKDLTSKDRGFRYGKFYKSHTHRGLRDLGIKELRDLRILGSRDLANLKIFWDFEGFKGFKRFYGIF